MIDSTIHELYQGTTQYDDVFVVPVVEDITISIKRDGTEGSSWDTKGNDYTARLKDVIKYVEYNPHTKDDKLLLILQHFRDTFFGGVAGLEITGDDSIPISPYEGSKDYVWNQLKSSYNVDTDRRLRIVTYGTAYIHEKPKKIQRVFNAAVLRGTVTKRSPLQKKLIKLRGTDYRLQQSIRDTALFVKFINQVVKEIEQDDLQRVAIICRAGHHRSVACAEMLRHLYNNVVIKHLTIDT